VKLIRVSAIVKTQLKAVVREPALLFVLLLFPVALTVAFGASFGAIGGTQLTVYHVGIVDQGSDGPYSQWSGQFVTGLNATSIINPIHYVDNLTAQADLAQGKIQAIIILPDNFGQSCQSFQENPASPELWSNATLSLYLDSGSMFATQAIPPILQQVLSATVYTAQQSVISGPIKVGEPSMVSSEARSAFDYMVPGIFAFASIFLIMSVAGSFTGERENGVLRRISLTPISAAEFMTGKTFGNMLLAIIQVAIVFGITYAMGFHSSGNWMSIIAAFATVAVFSLCNVGFGLITATIAKSANTATGIAFIFVMPQMFLGTFVSSGAVQTVGRFVPSYYVTDALTSLLLRGAPVWSMAVLMDLAIVASISVTTLLIGIALFRRYGKA
jgi:ABC-type transport system involved in multi-copper enzyme maturation permease subunit